MRRGQAIVETLLALVFVTFLFLVLFQLSHLVTGKILLDHAAARAARARAVGFNEFMCRKAARVAVIPVAGRRLWPADEETFSEAARIPIYLCTDHEGLARGVLEYERWSTMSIDVESGGGLSPVVESSVSLTMPRFFDWGDGATNGIRLTGSNEIESHFPYYMEDQGL